MTAQRILSLVTFGTSLGCGLIAGTFFAFSTFVMPALAKLPASQGIAAMQSINVVVINRWFMGAFMGTALACLVVAIWSMTEWSDLAARLRIAACALYLVGTIGVTVSANVPRNDALATVDAESPAAIATWPTFVREWTTWNTVRGVAALSAAALFTVALLTARDRAARDRVAATTPSGAYSTLAASR